MYSAFSLTRGFEFSQSIAGMFEVDDWSVPGFIDPHHNFIFCFESRSQKLIKVSSPVTTSVYRLGFCQRLFDTFCFLHPPPPHTPPPISGVRRFGRAPLYTPFPYIGFHEKTNLKQEGLLAFKNKIQTHKTPKKERYLLYF